MKAWVRAASSVSYTHLRAHETVLDLVCRLLLDKKKYTKKKKKYNLVTIIADKHISYTERAKTLE